VYDLEVQGDKCQVYQLYYILQSFELDVVISSSIRQIVINPLRVVSQEGIASRQNLHFGDDSHFNTLKRRWGIGIR
jgi:hypothetical protein